MLFSAGSAPADIPTDRARGLPAPTASPARVSSGPSNGHGTGVRRRSLGLDLHLPDDQWRRAPFHAPGGHSRVLLGKVSARSSAACHSLARPGRRAARGPARSRRRPWSDTHFAAVSSRPEAARSIVSLVVPLLCRSVLVRPRPTCLFSLSPPTLAASRPGNRLPDRRPGLFPAVALQGFYGRTSCM